MKSLVSKKEESRNKRRLSSKEIFGESREVIIEHNEDHYRLIITKAGKLILNK